MSAEAVAAFLDSEHYPVEEVAEWLAELKADGNYGPHAARAMRFSVRWFADILGFSLVVGWPRRSL
jgi:hypothetical protein